MSQIIIQKNSNPTRFYIVILILACIGSSCKKMVEVDPPFTSTNSENVYSDNNNAIAVLTGIYTQMSRSVGFSGSTSLNLFAGLSSDELALYNQITDARFIGYYTNSLMANGIQNYGSDSWGNLYLFIYYCNSVIEGLDKSTSLSSSVKAELLGEAKFLRAFYYFYLVNSYGAVPLALSADYKINSLLPRSSISEVYSQIIADLKEAQKLLNEEYLDVKLAKYPSVGSAERVRPTKWAATALLARVYLYKSDFAAAETEATTVINNSSFFSLQPLNSVFLKNNAEAIWQLQPVTAGRNTEESQVFILSATTPPANGRPVYLSNNLMNAFEANDQRKSNWVGTYTTYSFPNKYKNNTSTVTEYLTVLRLAEQYLIRAEARTRLNNIPGAQADINTIRSRAGLPSTSANNEGLLLAAILKERQVEFFSEWGHRWFDLKRTETINGLMSTVTPAKSNNTVQWQPYKQLYPLPFSDLDRDPNLIQNPGY